MALASLPSRITSLHVPTINIKPLLSTILIAFLPSFIKNNVTFLHSRSTSRYEHLTPTAFIDGLRGTAALIVVIHHITQRYFPNTMWGYGLDYRKGFSYFHLLPIVRYYVSGDAQVCVFFILSGLVLAHKPLSLMRSDGSTEAEIDVHIALASSTFRRWVRLFLPLGFAYLLTILYIRLGFFVTNIPTSLVGEGIHRYSTDIPSWGTLLKGFVKNMGEMSLPMARDRDPMAFALDLHTWTIPVEWQMSMVVYISLLGLAYVKPVVRMGVIGGVAAYAVQDGARWQLVLFFSGVLFSELMLMLDRFSDNTDRFSNTKMKTCFWYFVFGCGMFLQSAPQINAINTPGYRFFLQTFAPATFFTPSACAHLVGAELILVSLLFGPKQLRAVFETRLAQYLGKISYILYLLHGPLLHSVCDWSILKAMETFGIFGGYVAGIMGFCVVLFWMADVLTVQEDARSIELAKRLERLCWREHVDKARTPVLYKE